jgi:predicted phage terminase large subunit-like protein
MPGGAIVVIQTRWHEDDLSGWLQAAHSHEDWEVINLPAISEDNKPLWPEMYDLKTLEAIRESIGMRDWNALYQQNPIPDAGDFFKREWFQFYDTPPTGMYIYGASDFAVTEGKGDFTEHGIFGIDSENNIYILDWWSGQTNSDDWINSMLDLQDQWKTFRWFGESGVIRRAIEPMLAKRMEERKVYLNREWMASMADKATRARNFQNRAAGRKVFLPRRTQWAADLLSQIVRFPAGLHDDKVDVCSLIGRGLQFASAPSASNVKSIDAYRMKKSKSTSPWAA